MKKNRISIFLLIGLLAGCFVSEALGQDKLVKVQNLNKVNILKDAFKDKFLIGAALNEAQFSGQDKLGSTLVETQFNSISPENVLKWESVHPLPDKYNFEPVDRYVAFGKKNNMFVIGHVLVWHYQTPKWVFEDEQSKTIDRETLLQRMHDHIKTVVGRYKGQVQGWDVVNEALNDDGTLRQTQWMKIIGDDYISKAFQFAHEADPQAELYYNDYSIENSPKREGTITLIKKLQSQGIRVDGVGIQGHYKMDWPTMGLVDSALEAFSRIGLKVMITELDMDVLPIASKDYGANIGLRAEMQAKLNPYIDGLPDSVQQVVAKRYADLFSVFVKHSIGMKMEPVLKVNSIVDGGVSRVTFWGVTDGDSWLNNWPIKGRTNYPLLFDRNGKPNATFDAVIKVAGNYPKVSPDSR